ncbi:restriction endonuclease subunit S [Nostoc sp. CCY0012]|uniref:restriction endonuclease subunit S n=1 Tax=Nostoc sp. CCY0012 TaxID=1056123 RepID=UPI0039C6F6B4
MQLTVDSGQLPVGWDIKTLGEICKISTGKLNANAAVENGKYPFFTCSREIFAIDCFAFDCEAILLAGNNAVGDFNVKHYKGKFNAYQRTYVITINQEELILYRYLYLCVENALKDFKLKSVGAGTKFLKLDMIKNLKIHLPPLSEQKRIVVILDEAFEGIDRAIANTEKNLANSRELFESYLNAIFTQKGDRWKEVRPKLIPLSTLLSKQPRNGWSPPARFQADTGIPVLTLSAVTGFYYDGSRVKLTNAPTTEEAHYWLEKGELLITRSNTPELVGHVALYDGNPSKAICPDLIMKMTVDHTKADTRFIYYFLRSATARKYITGKAKGASSTMPKITKQVVQETPIPTFNLTEQRAIVKKLDKLAIKTQRLETIYRQKIAALNELKQSILQKAFTGELTADTPKTAKQEIAA